MYCKAPVKLMVYSYGPRMREFHKQCERLLNEYGGHVLGEIYLLVQFCDYTCGEMQGYTYVVRENGIGAKVDKAFVHKW